MRGAGFKGRLVPIVGAFAERWIESGKCCPGREINSTGWGFLIDSQLESLSPYEY